MCIRDSRIVHGGPQFTKTTVVTDEVLKEYNTSIEYAPLHNPAHLQGINACMKLMPGTPEVLVFDTSFHTTIPDYAASVSYTHLDVYKRQILWIIDNMYLPEHKDATQMKDTLVRKVLKFDGGNNVSEEQLKNLTDDDIEFVQQMALWYFTNHDDNGGQNSLSLVDTYVLSNATKINEEDLTEDKQRAIDSLSLIHI